LTEEVNLTVIIHISGPEFISSWGRQAAYDDIYDAKKIEEVYDSIGIHIALWKEWCLWPLLYRLLLVCMY
jgi:hypothetical protein